MESSIFKKKMNVFSPLLMLGVVTVVFVSAFLLRQSYEVPYAALNKAHASEKVAHEIHSSKGQGHSVGDHSIKKEAHHGGAHPGSAHSRKNSAAYESPVVVDNILPFLVVLIPVLTVFSIPFVGEKQSLEVAAYGNLLSFLVNLLMIPFIWNGEILQFVLGGDSQSIISMAFFADSLSFIVGIVANFVWAIVSFYSIVYMSHEKNIKRYNIFSLLSLTGMLGVVYSRNLFSLYIFFEMLSICSYVMVIHEETEAALEAGLKYVTLGIGGGLTLFACFVLIYILTGTVDLLELSTMSEGLGTNRWMPFLALGMIFGFGVKAGMFPVHIWLPDAHPQAPAPASALLSGIMIKAGGYGIIRVIYNIVGVEFMRHSFVLALILVFAFINIFLGSAMAIRAKEIKRMLAYSSISQIGYVLLGTTVLTQVGIIGAVIHIFNHALMKGTLFMCAGAFIHQTGLRQVEDLKGIGKKMPIVTFCFTMAGMSMIGLPPFSGFISKWFLALGALDVANAGSYGMWVGVFALLILVTSSFMNLLYYGPIIYGAWFKKRKGEETVEVFEQVDPEIKMWLPLLILAMGILVFGIFPQFPIHFARIFSASVFH